MKFDEKDIELLKILQNNCKQSLKEIARAINSPVTTVYDRIKKFEKDGIIKKYIAVLDNKKLNKPLTAFIFVSMRYHYPNEPRSLSQREVAKKIAQLPNVQEVHIISGDWDILLKIKVRDMDEVSFFVIDQLRYIKGVDRTFTCNCLEVIKEGTELLLSR